MFNHAPSDYVCPICLGVNGEENDKTLIKQSDVVYRDKKTMCFVTSFFIGKNPGHLVIVPTEHYENLYDLPIELAQHIITVSQKMAVAMRNAYECEGVTILQNNEPAGNQHAFHYHMHLFPRYENDNLHAMMMDKKSTTADERLQYVEKMKNWLEKN